MENTLTHCDMVHVVDHTIGVINDYTGLIILGYCVSVVFSNISTSAAVRDLEWSMISVRWPVWRSLICLGLKSTAHI